MCRDAQGYIVHHKVELTPDNINDPDVTLNMANLLYLCQDCHNKIHGKEEPRSVFVGGEVLPPCLHRKAL